MQRAIRSSTRVPRYFCRSIGWIFLMVIGRLTIELVSKMVLKRRLISIQ